MKLGVILAMTLLVSVALGAIVLHDDMVAQWAGVLQTTPAPSAPRLVRLIGAIVIALTSYGILAALTLTIAFTVDLISVHRQLSLCIANGNASVMSRGEWDHVFFGTFIEPLAFRLVARAHGDGGGFCLASPYSPALARTELRRFYYYQMLSGQVWTSLVLVTIGTLLAHNAGASLFPALSGVLPYHLLLNGLGLETLVTAIGIMSASAAIEHFLTTLSSFPFKIESSIQLRCLTDRLDSAMRDLTRLLSGQIASPAHIDGAVAARRIAAPLMALSEVPTDTSYIGAAGDALIERLTAKLSQPLLAIEATLKETAIEASEERRRLIDLAQSPAIGTIADTGTKGEEIAQMGRSLQKSLEDHTKSLDNSLRDGQLAMVAEFNRLITTLEGFSRASLPNVNEFDATSARISAAANRQEAALDRLGLLLQDLAATIQSVDATLQQPDSAPLKEHAQQAEIPARDDAILAQLNALQQELDAVAEH